jgi:hypothetical protein
MAAKRIFWILKRDDANGMCYWDGLGWNGSYERASWHGSAEQAAMVLVAHIGTHDAYYAVEPITVEG